MRICRVTARWGHADFAADYECGHCGGRQHNGAGYADANYHENVIPKMVCEKCGKDGTDEPNVAAETTGSGDEWIVGRHLNFPFVLATVTKDPARMPPEEARMFAAALIKAAEIIEEGEKNA